MRKAIALIFQLVSLKLLEKIAILYEEFLKIFLLRLTISAIKLHRRCLSGF